MKASDVFTPGKMPEVTYIDDHLVERAQHLADALDGGAVAVSLSGPSKSGKTVFVEKNIGRDRLIQVTGAGVDSAATLWKRVFAIIGTDLTTKKTVTEGFAAGGGAKVAGGIPLVVQGEINSQGTWSDATTTETTPHIDYLALLIKELSDSGFVVFIDDFHYIVSEAQEEISYQIKEAIRNKVLFIIASVPYHSDDAVRANSDLRGRSINIDFNYWGVNELQQIARRGFDALRISLPDAYVAAMADEAAGSPQLMQVLCLNTCYELNLREEQTALVSPQVSMELIKKVCSRASLSADYSSTVAMMKEGPKTRGTNRAGHLLKTGEIFDVYPLIVRAISQNPPELTIRYANLLGRIAQLCANDPPTGSSVTGACAQMCSIANASENRTIVEWDSGRDVFNLLDPYLLFFLRWSKFA